MVYTYNAAGRKAGRADMSPVFGIKEMMDCWRRGVMWDAEGAAASSLISIAGCGVNIVGHMLGKSYTTLAGSFPSSRLPLVLVRICYPSSSVHNTWNPELHPFTYPFPKAWGEEAQPMEWRWGAGVPLWSSCSLISWREVVRECSHCVWGLPWLPRSLVTGNVKTFLTLMVFSSEVSVTLSSMLRPSEVSIS